MGDSEDPDAVAAPPAAPQQLQVPAQQPTRTDEFGFIVQPPRPRSGYIEVASLTAALRRRRPKEPSDASASRREEQWTRLAAEWTPRTAQQRRSTIKAMCRQGVPQALRGRVWGLLADVARYRAAAPGGGSAFYTRLLEQPPLETIYELIERDVHRCYPTHVQFRERTGEGQQALRRVLQAYAQYNKEIGYCQGMGLLVGMLLMQASEEDAFWLLVAVLDRYLPGYYHPSMLQLRVDAGAFQTLVPQLVSRAVGRHFAAQGIDATMYVTQWFLSLFTLSLRWDLVLRVWDVFFSEGPKVLFRAGLAVLRVFRRRLVRECPTIAEILQLLLHVDAETLDQNAFLREMFSMSLSRREIAHAQRLALQRIAPPVPAGVPAPAAQFSAGCHVRPASFVAPSIVAEAPKASVRRASIVASSPSSASPIRSELLEQMQPGESFPALVDTVAESTPAPALVPMRPGSAATVEPFVTPTTASTSASLVATSPLVHAGAP